MTNDILCGYTGDREAMLMSYLYGEIAPADREAFEQHLATCARCRTELNGLDDVRGQLVRWSPPEPNFNAPRRQATIVVPREITDRGEPESAGASRLVGWRALPAWAQVAAALLVFGVAAGMANLDVHYDSSGLTIRTGWMTNRVSSATAVNPAALASKGESPAWRAELTALEQQLRSELRASQLHSPPVAAQMSRASTPDAEIMRRVKALLDESERRQQNELALRMGEVIRDLNLQRQADLRKIDQNFGLFQDRTGVEVLRNRQKLDYILQRVSQQPQ
jgi:hypothetical protein